MNAVFVHVTKRKKNNNNIKYVKFAFEISGIAENRIWDPVGSVTSTLISRLFNIQSKSFLCHIKMNAVFFHVTKRKKKNINI